MYFKGKVPEKVVAELKASISDPLFKWQYKNEDEIVFRPITQAIKKKITDFMLLAEAQRSNLPVHEINEKIYDLCVVWPLLDPEERMRLPVGAVPSIVKVIQEKSGYIDIDIMNRVLGPDIISTTIKDYNYWNDITAEEVEEIKKSTVFNLCKVIVGRWVFVCRPMTRTDMQIASQAAQSELALVKCTVMWPKQVDWDTLPSGVIDRLAKEINELSGWDGSVEVTEL